ncbi:MAG: response regulator [Opitutaceae bacterium]|nr:response regulator [Verrucomicrobiales bacterium]
MKTLLVIAQQPGLGAAIRSVLNPEHYRVVAQADIQSAEALLNPATVDICILDVELTSVAPIRIIERLRHRMPQCPILIYASAKEWEWEEEAYLLGVHQVLAKPVRSRLLVSILDRLNPSLARTPERNTEIRRKTDLAKPPEKSPMQMRTLEVMRNFSTILSHNLCAESLLKEFLLMLREIIGVNRAAIFLRPPPGALSDAPDPDAARRLRSACAIGLTPGLLEHFQLSLDAGIGRHIFRSGRILRRDSEETEADPQMQQEFELLGAQVAIPILDRESFVGLAVFDGRVTGELMSSEELSLIFHLLEELGLTVKNIWLHDQLGANNEMMAEILRRLNSACVVIGRDLTVLHANEMARTYFHRAERRVAPFEFSDLPQVIGSKVFEVLKTGREITAWKHQPADSPGTIFNITISPFQKAHSTVPSAALLVVDDFSKTERLQQLEIEAANLRLVKQMAERLAHEIGNATVSLSTFQQLMPEKSGDPEFMDSFSSALSDGVKRVNRLVSQMRYLASDRPVSSASIPVKQLIEGAFTEARLQQPFEKALMQFENGGPQLQIPGDRAGLQHAFAEVILNALQSNALSPQVVIRTDSETDANGRRWVRVEFRDNGAGFAPEVARKASEPFFTTRNVGLGLGLTVSNKIIETHRGKLEISPTTPGLVRITLPADAAPELVVPAKHK